MKQALRYTWAQHRLLLLSFAATLAITLFFLIRAISETLYWANPAHQDVEIRSWMTPGYIAKSYQLEPHFLFDAIPYVPIPGEPRSLRQISDETGRSVEELASVITAAIIAARSAAADAAATESGVVAPEDAAPNSAAPAAP